MSKSSVSTVLYSDKETNYLMRETCRKVQAAGGTFSIRQYFEQNWLVEYTITQAEDKQCST